MNAPRKGKMGRPSLPAGERRTTHVVFYLTKSEKKLLEEKAKAADLSLSGWLAEHHFPTRNEPAPE